MVFAKNVTRLSEILRPPNVVRQKARFPPSSRNRFFLRPRRGTRFGKFGPFKNRMKQIGAGTSVFVLINFN